MLREYFNDTTEQSFLKALLSAVQLPKYKIVQETDFIYEGYFYIYDGKIIRCTKSGCIVPEDTLIGSVSLVGNSLETPIAEFDIIKHYNFSCMDQNDELKEFIRASYYSTELHKRFGEYLRCIRDLRGINLMGMYNCFSYEIFDDIYVDWDDKYYVAKGTNKTKKLLAIPIKYNQQYTIALSAHQVIAFPIIKLANKKLELKQLSDYIKVYQGTRFEEPFKISIDLTEDDGQWYNYENDLYLVLQVSATNKSSLAALEGDYTVNSPYVMSVQAASIDAPIDLMYKPSLLQYNDGMSYAYSNTIIQYLTRNAITSDDITEENISYTKSLLNFSDRLNYWDNNIKYAAYMKYIMGSAISQHESEYCDQDISKIRKNCSDVTGFIDKQIEEFLVYA